MSKKLAKKKTGKQGVKGKGKPSKAVLFKRAYVARGRELKKKIHKGLAKRGFKVTSKDQAAWAKILPPYEIRDILALNKARAKRAKAKAARHA